MTKNNLLSSYRFRILKWFNKKGYIGPKIVTYSINRIWSKPLKNPMIVGDLKHLIKDLPVDMLIFINMGHESRPLSSAENKKMSSYIAAYYGANIADYKQDVDILLLESS